jgi:hypothetical protein
MVVEAEMVRLQRFGDSLRGEDKEIFADLLRQCKLYASAAGAMAATNKEFPLLFSMLFSQHRRIIALEKQQILNTPSIPSPPKKEKYNPHAAYVK